MDMRDAFEAGQSLEGLVRALSALLDGPDDGPDDGEPVEYECKFEAEPLKGFEDWEWTR